MADIQNTKINAKGDSSSYTDALNKMIEANKALEMSFQGILSKIPLVNDAFDSVVGNASKSGKSIDNILDNIGSRSGTDKFTKTINDLTSRRAEALEKATSKIKSEMDQYNKALVEFEKNKAKIEEAKAKESSFKQSFFSNLGVDNPDEIMRDINDIVKARSEIDKLEEQGYDVSTDGLDEMLDSFREKYNDIEYVMAEGMFGPYEDVEATVNKIVDDWREGITELKKEYSGISLSEPVKPVLDTSEIDKLDKKYRVY